MTGRDLLLGVRRLLHDDGRGVSTSARFFSDEEILVRLNDAKRRLGRALVDAPRPLIVTHSRLLKSVPLSGAGGVLPAGFYRLLAGIGADDRYIPQAPLTVAEPLLAQGHEYVYAEAGHVYGPTIGAGLLVEVVYAQDATEKIANTNAPLTEFPDGFYFAIMLLAARDALPKEKSDAADRWKFFNDMIAPMMASFG